MEQASKNLNFMETQFFEYYENDKLNLSDKFLDQISSDEKNPFLGLMKTLKIKRDQKKFGPKEIKMYVMQQYTKGRHPPDYLIEALKGFGQEDQVYLDLAETLACFNRTDKFADSLTVLKTSQTIEGLTNAYPMTANPRGVCVIILNEDELETEAQAFHYVFEQLYFKVEVWRKLRAQQILSVLSNVSKNPDYKDMNALVTVCIGHGGDECFLGSNYDPNDVEMKGDRVPIVQLVDIFNEDNCKTFEGKPKINLFICCRDRTKSVDENINELKPFHLDHCFKQDWQNKNSHTTIIYSCAEGLETLYNSKTGYSYYGRAFLTTIAQFARDSPLTKLLDKVNKKLIEDQIYHLKSQVVRHFCTQDVYFNPGYHK